MSDPVITLSCGAVRGRWRGEPGDPGASAAFLGIPFAEPPVGERRFAAPVPVPPWDGVRDATAYGATAQRGDTGITLIPEPSVEGDSTLNVNVFTPRPGDTDAALPVLVYIHGGGFTSGSPASPWYDGRAFNRDGVVTVSISYRLGFDGFGEIPDAPTNRGVRDWLAALEWVQRHIRDFGGDPTRVTIAGQSAGGAAVLTLLGMPAAQHLFHSAWRCRRLSATSPQNSLARARSAWPNSPVCPPRSTASAPSPRVASSRCSRTPRRRSRMIPSRRCAASFARASRGDRSSTAI
ncbi:carboxylesterase family protein [Microbacterium kunmingense]|uniref:carboxylesterase family protein n=1 Tax=Microbacterium kunmingense TaxID=2915939 RepID=UPI003D71F627